jgi:hypothetical protein
VIELPRTAATDPGEELQSPGAVSLVALVTRTARVGNDAIEPVEIGGHALAGGHAPIVITRERIRKGRDTPTSRSGRPLPADRLTG